MDFPIINSLDDVIDYAKDRDDIVIGENDVYTVIKYTHADTGTFSGEGAEVRREFRGLMFDTPTGNIMSRPFHKFFNVEEKEETMTKNIDLSKPHRIQTKMDGSMVRPINYNNTLRLATKSGVTEVSEEAMGVLDAIDFDDSRATWMWTQIDMGRTPILEYVGPLNRIVVPYNNADLIFLALRDNVTGQYLKAEEPYPGSRVASYGEIDGDISEYIESVRGMTDAEGHVLVFDDGFRVKIKSDWYIQLHSLKEDINKPRYIAAQVLDKTIDDTASLLSEDDRELITQKANEFIYWYYAKQKDLIRTFKILGDFIKAQELPNGEPFRKVVATEFVPALRDQRDARFVYAVLDFKDFKEQYEGYVRAHLTSDTRYNDIMEWMSNAEIEE